MVTQVTTPATAQRTPRLTTGTPPTRDADGNAVGHTRKLSKPSASRELSTQSKSQIRRQKESMEGIIGALMALHMVSADERERFARSAHPSARSAAAGYTTDEVAMAVMVLESVGVCSARELQEAEELFGDFCRLIRHMDTA